MMEKKWLVLYRDDSGNVGFKWADSLSEINEEGVLLIVPSKEIAEMGLILSSFFMKLVESLRGKVVEISVVPIEDMEERGEEGGGEGGEEVAAGE